MTRSNKKVLTAGQLKSLENHKYSSAGVSLLEPYFQIYWRWLIERFPETIAPNTITTIGLAVNALCSLLLIYYCPNAKEEAPWWVYFANGVGLFIYQSLDAIDGKQARRTNSSTPLGELFDHGCDSISTILVALSFACTLKMGDSPPLMAALCVSSCVTFYASHWCSYVQGKLQFGKFDVTELQLGVIGSFFLTSFCGTAVWDKTLPFTESLGFAVQLKYIPFVGIIVGCASIYYRVYNMILDGGCGLNGSTIANTSVLSPSFNIGAVVICFSLIVTRSTLLQNHPLLFLFYIGLVSAKVTNCLIVAHMTRSAVDFCDPYLIGLITLLLNQYLFNNENNTDSSKKPFITPESFESWEFFLLCACFVHSIYDLSVYLTAVYKEISEHLNIYIFSLQKRESSEKKDS